ncbi:hypothetical protein IU436_30240 [Nocardia farcinica]|nr:hypothetical protein [Nocardia farcinica]MBF6422519.1 hypothetical protein [Nocardia farcinica]MBF6434595.1 hypothetical protein [Nocardia farcinica]
MNQSLLGRAERTVETRGATGLLASVAAACELPAVEATGRAAASARP